MSVCVVDDCGLPRRTREHCAKHHSRMVRTGRVDIEAPWTAPLAERLAARTEKTPDGCWRWTGRVNGGGYGSMSYEGRAQYVHRLSYEVRVGPIPDGMQIDHLCRNTRCLNPEHLEPVTQAENIRRAARLRTACVHGHDWTDPRNVAQYPDTGWRYCAECCRIKSRRRYRLKRAAS